MMKNVMKIAAVALLSFSGWSAANACTSWCILPEMSRNGMMIVHKCRDQIVHALNAELMSAANGHRWLRIGSLDGGAAFMLSDRGVVIIMNSGDSPYMNWRKPIAERYNIFKRSMAEAENAESVIKMFDEGAKKNALGNHGNIIFVGDPNRVFTVEMAGRMSEAKEVTHGYAVYANGWRLPGSDNVSMTNAKTYIGNRMREQLVRGYFRNVLTKSKTLSPLDCFAASRLTSTDYCPPGICRSYAGRGKSKSLECCTFELDKEFPGVLSTAYIAIGPQRNTLYIPTPVSVKKLHEAVTNGAWGQCAFDLVAKVGEHHNRLNDLRRLETKFYDEHCKAREEARKLLREGKRDEAVTLLNQTYHRHASQGWRFLTRWRTQENQERPLN